MSNRLTIRRPDDWHVHLRDGAVLQGVAGGGDFEQRGHMMSMWAAWLPGIEVLPFQAFHDDEVAGCGRVLRPLIHPHDVVVRQAVQFFGGDASLDERLDVVENFASEASGDAHFFDFFRQRAWRRQLGRCSLALKGQGGHEAKDAQAKARNTISAGDEGWYRLKKLAHWQ